jgi:alkylhydroperoxidase/carboxymuconolactone decarboxylase family protein YurZ
VDEVERFLRLVALNDEESVANVMGTHSKRALSPPLSPKVDVLVRLGALLALGAATASLRAAVHNARAAGATETEIADVLIAVAPAVGLARVVASAPRLAAALGYELDAGE